MSDQEKLKALFDDWGVSYTEDDEEIIVERGYTGFYTSFLFNERGSFQDMGAWE